MDSNQFGREANSFQYSRKQDHRPVGSDQAARPFITADSFADCGRFRSCCSISGACRCAFRNRSGRWRTWRGTAPHRPHRRADTVAGHARARLPRHDKGTIGTAMTMVATKAESGDRDFAAPNFRSKRGSPTFTVLRLTFLPCQKACFDMLLNGDPEGSEDCFDRVLAAEGEAQLTLSKWWGAGSRA